MSDGIYQDRMLALAAAADTDARLDDADTTVTLDNPLCGDRVTLDVRRDERGRVAAIGHQVRGCVLCRAAAAVLEAHASGHDAGQLRDVRGALRNCLKGEGPLPDAREWGDLAVFEPVTPHKSRHDCVLLPFDALLEALDGAD